MTTWQSGTRDGEYVYQPQGIDSKGHHTLTQIICDRPCNYVLKSRNELLQAKFLPGPGIYMLPPIKNKCELSSDVPVSVQTTLLRKEGRESNSNPLLVESATTGSGPEVGSIFMDASHNLMAIRVRGEGLKKAALLANKSYPWCSKICQTLARQLADDNGNVFINCGGLDRRAWCDFKVVAEGEDGPFAGKIEVTTMVLNYVKTDGNCEWLQYS